MAECGYVLGNDVEQAAKEKHSVQVALQEYSGRFGSRPNSGALDIDFDQQRFPWRLNIDEQAVIEPAGKEQAMPKLGEGEVVKSIEDTSTTVIVPTTRRSLVAWAEDSDGDGVRVCQQCKLPLGDFVHNHKKECVHPECMAQVMAQEVVRKEQAYHRDDRAAKDKQHSKYSIGWKVQHIPRNDRAASKLAMRAVPQGMVCLVLDETSHTVSTASTTEPAAAMHLEYLSIALEVRRTEGMEPVFSLDPVDPKNRSSMQKKVFVPEWLAGTSAGEVLFQSDYHLKELSMGEFEQPVVGMKSCFDYTEIDGKHGWSAREWFLVRKAEVQQLSQSNQLVPMVKMGVEAREQVICGDSLQDKAVTRKDHPMALYAEAFTKNFDLIAERKSVIYHLRELAKASVMAKYLSTSNIQLEESWFNLAPANSIPCVLEVPQLWNERSDSQISNQSGAVVGGDLLRNPKRVHGIYGGVRFGLEKFHLGASRAPAASMSAGVRMPQHRLSFVARQKGSMAMAPPGAGWSMAMAPPGTALSAGLPQQRLAFGISRHKGIMSMAPPGAPMSMLSPGVAFGGRGQSQRVTHVFGRAAGSDKLQGVDLRLDQFDLSQTKRVDPEALEGSWGGEVKTLDECVAMGASFFAALDSSQQFFNDDDCTLLRKVFNPALSDRRLEGDLFFPPDASWTYVQKLRDLVKGEALVCARRRATFISNDFVAADPGPLFPRSWTSSVHIAEAQSPIESQSRGNWQARSVSKDEAFAFLEKMQKNSHPVFDRCSEDGTRFRVYRLGRLEVRSTQEPECDEVAAVVFSFHTQDSKTSSSSHHFEEQEKISKVTEYVERAASSTAEPSSLQRRYYLVLEAKNGQTIVTERQSDGSVRWAENPEELGDRNSFAKVTRSKVLTSGITFKHMKAFQGKLTKEKKVSSGKRYTQAAFVHAVVFNGKATE